MMRWFADTALLDPAPLPKTPATASTIEIILNVVFATIGAIAVLIVVLAGIRLMFAQGDPAKIASARNTILYALIGLAVAIFGFTIVGFIVGKVA